MSCSWVFVSSTMEYLSNERLAGRKHITVQQLDGDVLSPRESYVEKRFLNVNH